jgi:acetolactate synthase I/III small subunit
MNNTENLVIELTVRNHPGVMSHITGLFSRRAFNMEGIICGRIGDGSLSRMYLLINKDERLEQIVKQLEKLYDVIDVSIHENYDTSVFTKMHESIH